MCLTSRVDGVISHNTQESSLLVTQQKLKQETRGYFNNYRTILILLHKYRDKFMTVSKSFSIKMT